MKYVIYFCASILICGNAGASWDGARWMQNYAEFIKNKPLNQIFIPGSHDSATYALENTIAKNQDITDKLNALKYIGVGFVVTAIAKLWSQAQNLTIKDQLYAGVRYLDLRVSYRDDDKQFYIVHGLYGPKLNDVMVQINEFLEANPREIVIIQVGDLRYMPNGRDDHIKLIRNMNAFLGRKIAMQLDGITPTSTVQDIWNRGRQAIIIYNNWDITNENQFVFPQSFIDSYWANADTIEDLKKRLDEHLENRMTYYSQQCYVVQAQMTPTTDTMKNAILHPIDSLYKSLSDMAQGVKDVFPLWLQSWKDKNPNIIITDFVDDNIARQIFELNKPLTK